MAISGERRHSSGLSLCPISARPGEAALDFELFPRLLRAARGSEGTALCDARTADVLLHLLWPVSGCRLCPDPTP